MQGLAALALVLAVSAPALDSAGRTGRLGSVLMPRGRSERPAMALKEYKADF
jgi:hypothetical protein